MRTTIDWQEKAREIIADVGPAEARNIASAVLATPRYYLAPCARDTTDPYNAHALCIAVMELTEDSTNDTAEG